MRGYALFLSLSIVPLYSQTKTDFLRDVQPIFESRCQACHGAQQQMGGLRLDSGDAVLKGATDGPVISPGKSASSRLIERVSSSKKGFAMPPVGEPLTTGQIAKLRAWIDEGAHIPAVSAAAAAGNPKSRHWAFQPVSRPAPPDLRNRAWVRNAIDQFIGARLESEGYAPSPEADRVTLIRRLSLDLLGLPPTPAEVDAFVADK
ncbi:MAG TPA: DUF1549 domain-containing protein, partial [Bryobacteraceae bacterium]|nr:DUF1549 domain-containing protein [Bryobacteraceae bacterium]